MAVWTWNGARWWKFDFHTHTPASDEYGKGLHQATLKGRTPKEWLLDYMRAGIDCVAITDHNNGAWIDRLKRALSELKSERPAGFRPIYLFPGIEISVNGGVHLLAIFGNDQTTSGIDSLLGAAGFSGTTGSSDAVTTKSFVDVVAEIERAGGIAVPAHVDADSGLFKLTGTTLEQALDCDRIVAMEVVDRFCSKPALYGDKRLHWTEVIGSDAHHPTGSSGQRCPGSQYTWVKMGRPSLEGLKLALLDGPLSVRRSDAHPTEDPNEHAALVLESIEVVQARYMGRSQPFVVNLNPWLNAIIGGRGTGKSTLVEFCRIALRRDDELPDVLTPEFEKYGNAYGNRDEGGLLTADAQLRVVYRKNGARYRVQWNPSGAVDAIREEVEGSEGIWQSAQGEVRQRFPIRIYSQKQIFHLAREPLALLRVVDEASAVDRRSWLERWEAEERRFLALRAKAREIEAGLAEEPRLRGELDDVKRKLAIFEEAGHAEVLKAFQRRTRQQRTVGPWEEDWSNAGERLREVAAEIVPDPLESTNFNLDRPEDADLHERASQVRARLDEIRNALEQLAEQVDRVLAGWRRDTEDSSWRIAVQTARDAYENLRKRLAEEGAGDPAAYGELVQRRQTIEQRLKDLSDRRNQVEKLREDANASLERLGRIRRELTESRRSFLENVLKDNRYVRIQVVPYGARETVEDELRGLLQRGSGDFEKDIGSVDGRGLLGELYEDGADAASVERGLTDLRRTIHDIADGWHDPTFLGDRRFATHIAKLPPETLDRLDLWFPEDSLEVQYNTIGDGQRFRSIQEGSPGQKTAALLAFLLSYGEEPLVLDQPEDDLDNHLICDLIVTQLRDAKRHRQIIVVTHNANIVVNGDAELVVALAARGGETQMECAGGLQEKNVRKTICEVMEGGTDAFKERYRRIVLEDRHV